jgi:hypothetical protein
MSVTPRANEWCDSRAEVSHTRPGVPGVFIGSDVCSHSSTMTVYSKTDRQGAWNVTTRCVLVTIVAIKNKKSVAYSGTSVHERPYSRIIRFTNKLSEQNVSDDEQCLGLRTRKLATAASWEYRRRNVSCWLTLAQYTSLLQCFFLVLFFHCCTFRNLTR